MIEATLASMRNSVKFFDTDQMITIVNGRKKEEVGFFVPKIFEKEFKKFAEKIEKKQKLETLKKVASAQRKDPIEDGAVDDGIK
ncbi:MAG: hypothetical protein OIF32_00035 [Campylobacterales bacterium]|nr:hypothetical protein [Campylobacterales bacterium]